MEEINLECSNLSKSYGGKTALDDVSLTLPKGAIVGLLGPNGSGKTTLIKLAAGLLTPTSGTIKICGMKPGEITKEIVAYQPDKQYLSDWMNVENLMNMMSDFYTTFNREKAADMLARLKINPKDRLKTMSKGTKEKVQLILTMSRDVPLYILDEPIGGVDPAARDYILNTIIGNYQENATVMISTHLISDIENVLNYIIFLKEGKVVRFGDVEDIREKEGKSIDDLFREEFRC
ncbi:MAG TPA: ABC transporter ATP-binding protein [Treponema sp.]|jgi:ABC-2 type transport system ATP-binding protein|nr:ABC transporter ATP-binding protein [Treponema sp.]HBB43159.1 ABC transporter ATP-binding protein [Treponema sp.]HCA20092.1 ABC transporter ATP-binding protein [Treponema sp.]